MRQFRQVIWDWNGTLFDDAWLCVEIINRLLVKRGLPEVNAEQYQREFTFPVADYYRKVGFDLEREPFAQLSVEFIEQYDRLRFQCNLQPGVREVLAALTTRGCRHSILSATEQSRLDAMISFNRLQEHFAAVVGISDCYANGKIDQGKRFISEMHCATSEVVLIGDTLHDYEVATAMGIACILIPSGHCSRARMACSGTRILDSVSDLVEGAA
ncbi:MAG TPA: HAD hydrolase-like protein [Armatimonadota bacterium]|jgi:phosphoglycolate phosphatase